MSERIYNALTSLVFAVMIFFIIGCSSSVVVKNSPSPEEAASGPLYEGDGGKSLRLAVLWPIKDGDVPDYVPRYVGRMLHNKFTKYSGITLFDRQNLERIIAEQNIAGSGGFTDEDYVQIGNLTNSQYLLIGTIQKLSGDRYALKLSVTHFSNGTTKADFMKNGTLREINEENGALINEATADLLAQLGVMLTDAGKKSLMAGNASAKQAEALLASGNTHLEKKNYDKAIADYDAALRLNPGLSEAVTNRQNAVNAKSKVLLANGNAHLEKKNYDKAIADYDAALRLNPGLLQAVTNRQTAQEEKERKQAEDEARKQKWDEWWDKEKGYAFRNHWDFVHGYVRWGDGFVGGGFLERVRSFV